LPLDESAKQAVFDEVLLKCGFQLHYTRTRRDDFTDNTVHEVTDGHRSALVCLAWNEGIEAPTLKRLRELDQAAARKTLSGSSVRHRACFAESLLDSCVSDGLAGPVGAGRRAADPGGHRNPAPDSQHRVHASPAAKGGSGDAGRGGHHAKLGHPSDHDPPWRGFHLAGHPAATGPEAARPWSARRAAVCPVIRRDGL
jgi:hypothetical protein